MNAARALSRVLAPEGFLLGLLLLAPHAVWFPALRPYVSLLAAAVGFATLGVGWRFGRGRVVQGLAVLGAGAVATLLPEGPAREIALLLIPLDLALIALLPERGLVSRSGALRAAVGALQVAAVAFLNVHPAALDDPGVSVPALPISLAVEPTWIAYTAGLAILAALALARNDAPTRGLLWAGVAALAAELGAPGGITWHVTAGALVLLVAALEEAYALAYRDGLTGLPSRRALDERLQRIAGRYTVAMVDVDHFKAFNDRHGHDVGDQVLRMVATRLRETRRARAYRYGGEEFTLVFRNQSLEDVKDRLDVLRERIADTEFVLRSADRPKRKPRSARARRGRKKTLSVTVSVGVAERSGRNRKAWDVVADADQALYRAKKRGRNRVVA